MLMLGTPPMVMVLDTTDMVDMVDMVIVLVMPDIADTMERGPLMLSPQLNLQLMLMLMLMLGMPLTAMVLDMPTVDMDMADIVDMDILLTDHMVDTTMASSL